MMRDARSVCSPSTPPYTSYPPHSPYIRRISPPGSPAPKKCCYEQRGGINSGSIGVGEASFLCCCYTCPKRSSTSVLATMAVCCLVLGYTILGAFVFMALEGGFNQHDTSVAASKSAPNAQTHIDSSQTSSHTLQNLQTAPGSSSMSAVSYSNTGGTSTSSGGVNSGGTSLNTQTGHTSSGKVAPGSTPDRRGRSGGALAGDLRSQTVDRLWSITENLNILYRENWTRLAAEEVMEFQEALFRALRNGDGYISDGHFIYHQAPHRWTFSSSFLYSLTLITTIGYGSVSPRTSWGKLVTIIYALVGIPLMLLYLSTTGDVLARSFRRLYGKLCGGSAAAAAANCGSGGGGGASAGQKQAPQCPCNARVKVPVTLCLIIVLLYICSGALLFHRLENWSLLEGSYFCFTSLGTIGFGDLLPGQKTEEVSLCACSAYIMTGMALVAMCFSLVQDEVLNLLRLVGATCSRTNDIIKDEEGHVVSS